MKTRRVSCFFGVGTQLPGIFRINSDVSIGHSDVSISIGLVLLFCLVLFYFALFCVALCCFVLSSFVLALLVYSCLFCLVLFCMYACPFGAA